MKERGKDEKGRRGTEEKRKRRRKTERGKLSKEKIIERKKEGMDLLPTCGMKRWFSFCGYLFLFLISDFC
jgi:hypothetical protein